jgi:exodeoxyribonuclease VII large subunit
MCFSDESLAREIFNSRIPVVTAIGHEIDWTLADYVSDLRLPTPTAVAGLLSPLRSEMANRMDLLFKRILKNIVSHLKRFWFKVKNVHDGIKRAAIWNFGRRFSLLRDLEQRLAAFDREKILRRGYAIVRRNGEIITSTTQLVAGDRLEIEIFGKRFGVRVI